MSKTMMVHKASLSCVSESGKHNWKPWKQRGSRERFQCADCTLKTGWTKSEQKECYPGEAVTATEVAQVKRNYDDLNSKTVASLKAIARDRGLDNYSKMRKAELVAALS